MLFHSKQSQIECRVKIRFAVSSCRWRIWVVTLCPCDHHICITERARVTVSVGPYSPTPYGIQSYIKEFWRKHTALWTHNHSCQAFLVLRFLVLEFLQRKANIDMHYSLCVDGVWLLTTPVHFSTAHLPALAALGASAPPLKAVYSRSEKSAKDLAQTAATILKLSSPPSVYFDNDSSSNLDVLLARSDISSVIVILPITTQPAIVLKALAAGKHVISEKPVAADVQSGLKLIADYNSNFKSKNLIWRVAENFEAEPGYQAAAAAIRAGKIGQVHSFKAEKIDYIDTETKWYKTPWRTIPDVSTAMEPQLCNHWSTHLFVVVSRRFLGMFETYLYHHMTSVLLIP